MILTGKAKIDFINWCKKQNDLTLGIQIPNTIGGMVFYLGSNVEILPKRILNALIIDWFDSVGIYIDTGGIDYNGLDFYYNIQQKNTLNGINGEVFKSRQEATNKAIKKANEIYNNL